MNQTGADAITLLNQAARPALNMMYPKEFELYMCALELMDQYGNTLRYFVFPVMPSNFEENQPQINNIKKTLAGVTVLSNVTFVPRDITISGNFGRKFRLLIGSQFVDMTAGLLYNSSQKKGSLTWSADLKTGYGCCKILESMIEDSNVVDDGGGIRRLVLYNPALGNNYLVKSPSLKFSMSQESNMIWNYTLSLKAIASMDALQSSVKTQEAATRLVVAGYAQKKVNQVLNELTSML